MNCDYYFSCKQFNDEDKEKIDHEYLVLDSYEKDTMYINIHHRHACMGSIWMIKLNINVTVRMAILENYAMEVRYHTASKAC